MKQTKRQTIESLHWFPCDDDVLRYALGIANTSERMRFRLALAQPDIWEYTEGARRRLQIFRPLIRGFIGIKLALDNKLGEDGRTEAWNEASSRFSDVRIYACTNNTTIEINRLEEMWDRIVLLDPRLARRAKLYQAVRRVWRSEVPMSRLVHGAVAVLLLSLVVRSAMTGQDFLQRVKHGSDYSLNTRTINQTPKTNGVDGSVVQQNPYILLGRLLNKKFVSGGKPQFEIWADVEDQLRAIYQAKQATVSEVLKAEDYLAREFRDQSGILPERKLRAMLIGMSSK